MDKDERQGREQDQHAIQQVEQGLVLDNLAVPSLSQFDGSVDGSVNRRRIRVPRLARAGTGCHPERGDLPDKDEKGRQRTSSQQDLGSPDLLVRVLHTLLDRAELCLSLVGRGDDDFFSDSTGAGLGRDHARVERYISSRLDAFEALGSQELGPPCEEFYLFRTRSIGPESPDKGPEHQDKGEHDDELGNDTPELSSRS